jgi:TetR/AcrR family transcriptional regulator, mexJK operon transcriptional repressor
MTSRRAVSPRSHRHETTRASSGMPSRPNLLAGESLPPSPSQARSRITRERLLAAGMDLFNRDGYEAVSIAAIAKRAGIAVGGFYQYFSSKRQLLMVLMNEFLQKLDRIDMEPPAPDLKSAIAAVLRSGLVTDLAHAGAYRAWKEAMLADAKLLALDTQIRRWTTARLRVSLRGICQLPGARQELNVDLFAALIDSLFWDLLGSGFEADGMVETLTHIIFHSIFTDPH